ncbi:MAG TPA: hypothetical protein VG649_24515 [Candidatus Angelobacter sp.]|jgi:hypothetical protein|nr:hypothetical protein [Candidatus Angelobacter sp.]
MTSHRKQPEERLSEALRSLRQTAEQSAPPEIYSALAGAFRSHHIRRRRVQHIRIVLASAACLIVFVALVRSIKGPMHDSQPNAGNAAVHLIPPQDAQIPDQQAAAQASLRESAKPHAPERASRAATVEDFLALPSYDPTIAAEGLRIIRLEGRGSDLRLAGAPVSEELSERRVVADFMVGHDGTPYAVRFVQ